MEEQINLTFDKVNKLYTALRKVLANGHTLDPSLTPGEACMAMDMAYCHVLMASLTAKQPSVTDQEVLDWTFKSLGSVLKHHGIDVQITCVLKEQKKDGEGLN